MYIYVHFCFYNLDVDILTVGTDVGKRMHCTYVAPPEHCDLVDLTCAKERKALKKYF
jgi:hypothetical protein